MATPLDALIAALTDTAAYNPAVEAPPKAVIWCDPGAEFAPIVPALRERLPQLLSFGPYDPIQRTGPAVWLRAAAACQLSGIAFTKGTTPILWLPNVARETLRGAEDCPAPLQPLVWLGVAGTFFGHVNGKDWTLRGFVAAERGRLKLDVADDGLTRQALLRAASRLFAKPLEELRGRWWDADALDTLIAPDIAADTLDWMNGDLTAEADPERFSAFAQKATKELKFDPRKRSRQDAAAALAEHRDGWEQVWSRFSTGAVTGYGKIVKLLELEEPRDLMADMAAYPRENAKHEQELRAALRKLAELAPNDAIARIAALENAHAWRRETVWAKRGEAPLAAALEHLTILATAEPLPAQDSAALGKAYAEAGWRFDWAALKALAAAPRENDRAAVTAALRALYLPWLQEGASALHELARAGKVPFSKPQKPEKATTLVFVDGLRMDLAHALLNLLETEGADARLGWQWSGFPTVTATCKPLVSPVAEILGGEPVTDTLTPVTKSGKAAVKPVLFKAMKDAGWETSESLLSDGKLWTETGRFDEEGHALGARLAERVGDGLRDVADRLLQLARSGRRVRVVTDHGWLLMPGALPQVQLDAGLVEPQGKRTRCALIKPDAPTTYLQLPWTWNDKVYVAVATGAGTFLAGQEYAHGGVSPQECVLPVIELEPLAKRREVSIAEAFWQGLRLRVVVPGGADLRVDLRAGTGTTGDSIAKGQPVLDENGRVAMLVSDEHEGKDACLVVLDDDDSVLARRVLKVGEDAT